MATSWLKATPVQLLVGSLVLVVVAAAASGYSSHFNVRRPYVQPVVMTQEATPQNVMTTSTPVSSLPDVAVVTSGDLTESVPPSWTFLESTTAPQHAPSISSGVTVSDQIRISAAGTSSTLRLTEYSINDQTALDKDLKSWTTQKVGKVSGLLYQPAGSKTPEGFLLEGTKSVVLISNDNGSAWPKQASGLTNEVDILVQSIRVQ